MNPIVWILLGILLISLLFSTLNYALRDLSRSALEEALAIRGKSHRLDRIMAVRHDVSLVAAMIRLVANIALAALTMYALNNWFEGKIDPLWVLAITIVTASPLLLVFSITLPHAWARYGGEGMVARFWLTIEVLYRILFPLIRLMAALDELVRRVAGVSPLDEPEEAREDILDIVSDSAAEGAVDAEQMKMIAGVISFHTLQVGQIMTPRTDIIALDINASLREVRESTMKDGVSRVPVYEGTLDNIVGVLYAKDLLTLLANDSGTPVVFDIRKVMHPPMFIPRTKTLGELLREFRRQQIHMAIVLDEYGGTSGLVTTEDIVEEIVGDIQDEYEKAEPAALTRINETTVEVDGKVSLLELNRSLDISLPEDREFQTIGGYVVHALGTIPARGATLEADGLRLHVLEADPRRVKKIRLEVLPRQNRELLPNSSPAN